MSMHKLPDEPIKPCPFCGGQAELLCFINETFVLCLVCNAQSFTSKEHNHERVIKAWNKRHTKDKPND